MAETKKKITRISSEHDRDLDASSETATTLTSVFSNDGYDDDNNSIDTVHTFHTFHTIDGRTTSTYIKDNNKDRNVEKNNRNENWKSK